MEECTRWLKTFGHEGTHEFFPAADPSGETRVQPSISDSFAHASLQVRQPMSAP